VGRLDARAVRLENTLRSLVEHLERGWETDGVIRVAKTLLETKPKKETSSCSRCGGSFCWCGGGW